MAGVLAQLGNPTSGQGTVLGALIALVSALASALVTQMIVSRATQRQARRTSRTEVYVELATAVAYLGEALLIPQKTKEAGLQPAPDGILQGLFKLTQAVAKVQLVGAPTVRKTLPELEKWRCCTSRFLDKYTKNDAGKLPGYAESLDKAAAAFYVAAVNDLGNHAALPGAPSPAKAPGGG